MEFSPERDSELFDAAPTSAAVFVLRGEADSDPYVGKSSNLRRRLQRLLGQAEGQSRKLKLRDRVREVEWWAVGSDFEAGLLLYKTLRREFPSTYSDRLRLRFAPLVKLILDNPYPRATVTTRISGRKSAAEYFGPFPTRVAAEKFASDSLDFFKMRRCTTRRVNWRDDSALGGERLSNAFQDCGGTDLRSGATGCGVEVGSGPYAGQAAIDGGAD